jgi:hypothetical protein
MKRASAPTVWPVTGSYYHTVGAQPRAVLRTYAIFIPSRIGGRPRVTFRNEQGLVARMNLYHGRAHMKLKRNVIYRPRHLPISSY